MAAKTRVPRGKDDAPVETVQGNGQAIEAPEPKGLDAQLEEWRTAAQKQEQAAQVERERANRLEQERRQAQQQAAQERARAEQAEKDAIVNGLAAQEQLLAQYQSEYAVALQQQDFGAAASVNAKMQRTIVNIDQLKRGQEELDEKPKQQQQQQQNGPTVDGFINYNAHLLSERQKQWLRSHPEVVENPQNLQTLAATYAVAERRGLKRDSDEYQQFFDETFGYAEDQGEEEGGEDTGMEEPRQPNRPLPGTSVSSRSVPTTSSNRPGTRGWLSAQEREAARVAGISEEEYLRGRELMNQRKREGFYGEKG